jgi:hypothetical protein
MRFLIQSIDRKLTRTSTQPYPGKELPPPEAYVITKDTQNHHFKLFRYSSGKDPIAEYHEFIPPKSP